MCSAAEADSERIQADLVLAGRVARARHGGGAADGGGDGRVPEAPDAPAAAASRQDVARALGLRARFREPRRLQAAPPERQRRAVPAVAERQCGLELERRRRAAAAAADGRESKGGARVDGGGWRGGGARGVKHRSNHTFVQ